MPFDSQVSRVSAIRSVVCYAIDKCRSAGLNAGNSQCVFTRAATACNVSDVPGAMGRALGVVLPGCRQAAFLLSARQPVSRKRY